MFGGKKTVTNQSCIHEEIKSRLVSGNACYHSVHNLLSSHLLSKNFEIKIYKTIILLLFCIGVKLGHSHWGKNIVWGHLRTGCWGKYLDLRGRKWQEAGEDCEELHNSYSSPNIRVINLRMRWAHSMHGRDEKCRQNFG